MEETGIDASSVQGEPLGIWESVFPATLEQGRPKRHCLVRLPLLSSFLLRKDDLLKVVYFLLRHGLTSTALSRSIRLSKDEADLALWADPALSRAIVQGESSDQVPFDHSSMYHWSNDSSLGAASVL